MILDDTGFDKLVCNTEISLRSADQLHRNVNGQPDMDLSTTVPPPPPPGQLVSWIALLTTEVGNRKWNCPAEQYPEVNDGKFMQMEPFQDFLQTARP
jgi:hypothetical protein